MLSLFKTILKDCAQKPNKVLKQTEQHPEKCTIITPPNLSAFANLWKSAEHEACSGNRETARSLLYQALDLQPDNTELLYQLGAIERKLEHYEEAQDNLLLVIHFDPKHIPAYEQLFILFCKQKNFSEAEFYIKKAIEIDSNNANLYCEFGNLRIEQEQYKEAVTLFNQAIDLSPDWGVAYNNLGNCYLRMKQYHSAEKPLLIALALRANIAEIFINLNYLYYSLGNMKKAYHYVKKGLIIYPDNETLNWMHCWLLLLYKRFNQGWNKYQFRFTSAGGVIKRELYFPAWQGEHIENKRILIVAEQGLGDQLMYASCLADLLNLCSNCIVECDPKLKKLFERSFPTIEFMGTQRQIDTEFIAALPQDVDIYSYMGDLPRWLRNDITKFFPAKAYIKADSEKVGYWRQRLDSLGNGLKIGISWRGGVEKTRTHFRTIPLKEWGPILSLSEIHFINLQYGDCEQELQDVTKLHNANIHHWNQAIIDYDETAALVEALDLVISVCTSVIHLTGSLGKEAWVFVPCAPEWRYLAREDSLPWYPNVKLFRQVELDKWEPLITTIAQRLLILTNIKIQK